MNNKINPRASTATSCSEGETKYVLEDVFWVPISNCRARHFTSPGHVELHPQNPNIGEVSISNKSETWASSAVASLVQQSPILSRVRARFAQTSGKRRSAVSDGGKH
jgi:hypothetical protein